MIDKDLIQFPQNPSWLRDHVIFLTLSGSRAYGTNIEGSDFDIKGVATLPGSVVFGFLEKFDQASIEGPYDGEIFGIAKFVKLAYDNNPNILELLFVDESSILQTTPEWESLRAIKQAFLSKKVAFTFAGYARSQLHRIRSHRGYLLSPILEIPSRKDFGLPERGLAPKLHAADAAVQKQLDSAAGELAIDKSQQIELYRDVAKGLGFDTNFVELLYKEKCYANLVAQKTAYDEWANNRNPKRKALEEKCGYDAKHLMHLVRLYRMCLECLSLNTLIVKRPDHKELVEIRQGTWPFEKIEAWASDAESFVQKAFQKTSLPKHPNLAIINSVVQKIIKKGALSGPDHK